MDNQYLQYMNFTINSLVTAYDIPVLPVDQGQPQKPKTNVHPPQVHKNPSNVSPAVSGDSTLPNESILRPKESKVTKDTALHIDLSTEVEDNCVWVPEDLENTEYKCAVCYEMMSNKVKRPPGHALCHHFGNAHLDKNGEHCCPVNGKGVKWVCKSIDCCPTHWELKHKDEILGKKKELKKTNRLSGPTQINRKEIEERKAQLRQRLAAAKKSSKRIREKKKPLESSSSCSSNE
jgi:hypothetical protein